MGAMKLELVKAFSFKALHKLPFVSISERANRPHEHIFQADVTVESEIDLERHRGELVDYRDIDRAIDPLLEDALEDAYLNEIEGLENPTSEEIARWLWVKLKKQLPGLKRVSLGKTCTSRCDYDGR